ncbi:hypothetical protein Tco_0989793 [Tanacetum coccineum]|uniref:Uncharacterized protein n=1 Tax=Tanacetum coccineum TaxID=301880 RepID=A0ABQ5EUT8_9ASTR
MVWRSASLRNETGEKKLNEVDFISQRVKLALDGMVVKEIEYGLLEEMEVSHFGKEVMILEWMLSLITTQIGSPIMLDTYTKYARALIEISAERELMESIVIAIPLGKGKGHTLATIDIDYEWKPPLCSTLQDF